MRPGIEPNNELGLTRDTQRGERIAVVIGSTRPTRICPGIAQWFKQAIQRESPLHYALIDAGAASQDRGAGARQREATQGSWCQDQTAGSYSGIVVPGPASSKAE